MRHRLAVLVILVLALAGCTVGISQREPILVTIVTPTGGAATAAPSPASTQAGPSTAVSPTDTASPQPSPLPPEPTAVPQSSPLPSPTTRPTSTPVRTATARPPAPTATPSRTTTARPPTPTATRTPTPTAVAPDSWWEVRSLLVGPGPGAGRLYAYQVLAYRQKGGTPGHRLLVSDDGGQTWSAFAGGLPTTSLGYQLDMDYYTLDALYFPTPQGVYRWAGSRWELLTSKNLLMVAVVYGQPQVVWATQFSSNGPAVVRSDDGGITWTAADGGLAGVHVSSINIDPTGANRLYLTAEYDGNNRRCLWRGTAAGQWSPLPGPNETAYCVHAPMSIDGRNGELYVVGVGSTYRLFRSRNPGTPDVNDVQWERLYDFGPYARNWAAILASGPGPNGLTLYANVAQPRYPGGEQLAPAVLQRSIDGGQSWQKVPIPYLLNNPG